MASADHYVQLSSLPDEVRRQVLDFIDFLMKREQQKNVNLDEPKKPKPIPGLLKGKVKIADDFDAPLDDFKEYLE